jgi:hypothetical protein
MTLSGSHHHSIIHFPPSILYLPTTIIIRAHHVLLIPPGVDPKRHPLPARSQNAIISPHFENRIPTGKRSRRAGNPGGLVSLFLLFLFDEPLEFCASTLSKGEG